MLKPSVTPEEVLLDLNPPREAVAATEGPLLILAGAGSGKTRVIAHRIAYLLGVNGVHPRNVIAVTFTNKAAEEMARRVEQLLLPQGIRPPLIATFHSACVRILREHAHHLGLKRSFVIYDEDDRGTLIKEILREMEVDERLLSPSAVGYQISHAKNQMIDVGEFERLASGPRQERIALCYRRYQARLAKACALDFDDLLWWTVRLFEQVPEVLAWYRGLWRYVLVDEADGMAPGPTRFRRYQEAEQVVLDDAVWISLYHYTSRALIKPYVKGLERSPLSSAPEFHAPLRKVWLDK